MGQKVVIRFQ